MTVLRRNRWLAVVTVLAIPAGLRAEDAPEGRPDRRPDGAAIFQRLDANNDGKITKDEVRDERGTRMLERLDQDGDGAVSREEFAAGTRPEPPTMPPEGNEPGRPERDRPEPGRRAEGPGGPEDRRSPVSNFGGEFVFRALDRNGDGRVDRQEMEDAIAGLKALDRNGDGEITRDEVGSGPARRELAGGQPPMPSMEMILNRLKQADTDGDGKLSKDEAPPRMAEHFEQIDTNSDGLLDETEVRQAAERMIQRMRDNPQRPDGTRPGGERPEGRRPNSEPGRPNPPPNEPETSST